MNISQITHITIMVKDQEEALTWFTQKLGFEKKVDDTTAVPGVRWLTVMPQEDQGIEIVLFQAQDQKDLEKVGKGTMWIFKTDDCLAATQELKIRGVKLIQENRTWPWGISTIFEDLYGNYYNLVELSD